MASVEHIPRWFTPQVPAPHSGAVAPSTSFLPKEHGSWSLAFEPLALGLLLAPSLAGVALLAAAAAGFFARRPLKAAFAPQFSEKRREAREALVMLSALVLAGGFELLVLGDPRALWPLLLAAPCGLLFAYFDGQGEGRAAAAEVAGSAAFAVLPAVFATLAGWSVGAALSLAALALVRSVPTVLTIRTFLRQRKGEPVSSWLPITGAAAGASGIAALACFHLLPWFIVAAPVGLLVRTVWLVGPWRPAWTARQAGIGEALLGMGYLGILAVLRLG